MKILIATRQSQGYRDNDFMWAHEGEPVMMPNVCNLDKDHVDGPCGCSRSLTGLYSRKGTTSAMVEDWPELTPALYLLMTYRSMQRSGMASIMSDANAMDFGASSAERIMAFCADLDEGALVLDGARPGTRVYT